MFGKLQQDVKLKSFSGFKLNKTRRVKIIFPAVIWKLSFLCLCTEHFLYRIFMLWYFASCCFWPKHCLWLSPKLYLLHSALSMEYIWTFFSINPSSLNSALILVNKSSLPSDNVFLYPDAFLCRLRYPPPLSLTLPPPSCTDVWGIRCYCQPYLQFQVILICFVKGFMILLFNTLLIFLEAEVEDFWSCMSVSLSTLLLFHYICPLLCSFTWRSFKHYLYQLVFRHPSLLTIRKSS